MLQEIAQAVIAGDAAAVEAGVRVALDSGTGATEILSDGLVAGMAVVGKRFRDYEMFLPEVIQSARAMQAGVSLLKPFFAGGGAPTLGKVVLGTVKGDIHDIGKNLVAAFLGGAGFEVVDLGIDVPPARFVEAVREHSPRIVAMSSLLTSTMPAMKETIAALEAAGLRGSVKVLVGGAPVTESYARSIGADGYGSDAATGASRARELAGASREAVGR